MFTNQVALQVNLVRVGDLRRVGDNNSVLSLSVVKSYSEKINDEWVELDPIYLNLTLWGKQAELFAASQIPNGSPLLVIGKLIGKRKAKFVTKEGVEIPERDEEEIIVDVIAPMIDRGRVVTVELLSKKSGAAPVAKTVKKKVNKVAEKTEHSEEKDMNFDDIFSDDSDSTTEDFDDIFA